MTRKTDKLQNKMNGMERRVNSIKFANQYFVKVADSCPLAIELQK